MARPLRVHLPNACYHVMSRGNAKQRIFKNRIDFLSYFRLLERGLDRFGATCLAYCAMWNHVHLILKAGPHPIARLMQHVNSAYCQGFNRRHGRVGHVLQGRYKALLIDTDDYLLRALRYVMLNPVESRYVRHPGKWPWSSYSALAGRCQAPVFLAAADVWAVFEDDVSRAQEQFALFVAAGDPMLYPEGPLVFGSEALRTRVATLVAPLRPCIDFSYAERLVDRPPLAVVFGGVTDAESENQAVCDAFLRHAYTLREIGQFLNKHPSTIWTHVRGVRSRSSNGESKIEI